jgi:hypothetical protein
VLGPNHGVRLCIESSPPRALAEPKIYMVDGKEVTDFSWTYPDEGSCWHKFHQFYLERSLFNNKQIDLSRNKIKFGSTIYTSELYQKKYEALGVEIKKKGEKHYIAYSAYTSLKHGYLGKHNRVKVPHCVECRMMASFF